MVLGLLFVPSLPFWSRKFLEKGVSVYKSSKTTSRDSNVENAIKIKRLTSIQAAADDPPPLIYNVAVDFFGPPSLPHLLTSLLPG